MKLSKYKFRSVLVAGPVSHDSFAENIIYTLKQMGIKTYYDQSLTQDRYTSLLRILHEEARARINRCYVPRLERRLVDTAKKNKPDVLLAPTQAVSEETLIALKKSGVSVCVAWWGDPPGNIKRMGLLSNQWDLIFLKDPDAVAKFKRVGLNTHLLHEAMNPAWHKPVASQVSDEVVVAGNFYGYRQLLVLRLMEKGIKLGLYGGKLPRWVHPEIQKRHTGRYIVREEKSRIFGEGLSCLNTTQVMEGNTLNCRAFEIAGAGGLHLMEHRPIISECFEPGKEILTFQTFDELLAHIEWAKKYPGEAIRVREAAAQRAHGEHTYRHRLNTIFEHINEL